MTVENQFPYQSFTANGSQANFALGFYVDDKSHFEVKKNNQAVSKNDYSYEKNSNSIVFNTIPKQGEVIEIQRSTAAERATNYATYNNSFRPEVLNKDIDRIWLKIQELGVADILLKAYTDKLHNDQKTYVDKLHNEQKNHIDNNDIAIRQIVSDLDNYVKNQDSALKISINNLRNYVDLQDSELRSYFTNLITQQGTSLNQLGEYYNYLIQRIAAIAVEKGWNASLIEYKGITQQAFNDGLEAASDLNTIRNATTGARVYVKSYYRGLGYGGGWYVYDSTRQNENDNVSVINGWVLQVEKRTVSIEQFGAKFGDSPSSTFNVFPKETTDNTVQVQKAFNFCLANKYKLISESGKCFFFENAVALQFYGNVEMNFNYATFYFSPALKANPKTDPAIQVSGCRKELVNLNLTSASYLGKGIEFNKTIGDNQALTVKNVSANTFRWGMYVGEGECINRIRVINCNFGSNYYAGIYISSFPEGGAWTHSAPVFFRDTICNANGVPNWILTSDTKYAFRTGGTIAVRDTENDVGVQAFFRGISGLHWLGGQFSAHGNPRNSALIRIENCNMATFDSFDLEDIVGYSLDGTVLTAENYTTYQNEKSGAAIVSSACAGLSIRSPNVWSIQAPAILKVMNNPASYDYQVATAASGLVFTVWDISSAANGMGACSIHPYAIAYGNSVSPTAFANTTNKEAVSAVIHHEAGNADFSVNWKNLKTLWQNGIAEEANGYQLRYLSAHNSPLTSSHLYNEFKFPTQVAGTTPNQYASWVFVELPHAQSGDGRFVIQFLNNSDEILHSNWHSAGGATHYPVSNWIREKVPTGTTKIRYGFVNSGNYIGYVRNHFWQTGVRYNDWHVTVHIVHDGNGAFRNKIRPNFSASINEYRGAIVHQASAVSNSEATDVAGLNTKFNELLTALRSAGSIKTS